MRGELHRSKTRLGRDLYRKTCDNWALLRGFLGDYAVDCPTLTFFTSHGSKKATFYRQAFVIGSNSE